MKMYRDLRKTQINIVIDLASYVESCGGCPTIYDFKDKEGARYYFRLRHGGARIVCEDTDEILLSGNMPGFDGVCNWEDIVRWAKANGILIKGESINE